MTPVWPHTFPPLHHIFHFSCEYLELFVSKCGYTPLLPSELLCSARFLSSPCLSEERACHRVFYSYWLQHWWSHVWTQSREANMNYKYDECKTRQVYLSYCLTACISTCLPATHPICLRYCLSVSLPYCLSLNLSACCTACISMCHLLSSPLTSNC